MKKLLIALVGIATFVTMAGSHGGNGNCGGGGRGCGSCVTSRNCGGGGCRPHDHGHRPRPCRPSHHGCGGRHHGCGGCGGSSGVRLATDIVELVGASLNVLAPRTVVATPVVTYPCY